MTIITHSYFCCILDHAFTLYLVFESSKHLLFRIVKVMPLRSKGGLPLEKHLSTTYNSNSKNLSPYKQSNGSLCMVKILMFTHFVLH